MRKLKEGDKLIYVGDHYFTLEHGRIYTFHAYWMNTNLIMLKEVAKIVYLNQVIILNSLTKLERIIYGV